ncbi:F-actin-capping protein subunit alpha [Entamoeba marina]
MATIPDKDIENTVNTFLNDAPCGEFVEVVKDVKQLIQRDDILNTVVPTAIENVFLLTPYNALPNSSMEYLDPVHSQIHTVDHYNLKVTGSRPMSVREQNSMETMRNALQQHLRSYTDENYPHGTGVVFVNEQDNTFRIIISAAQIQTANFHSGNWRSEFVFKVPSSGSVSIDGSIRIQIHYYEDGNIQMSSKVDRKIRSTVAGSVEVTAKNIIKAISDNEAQLHTQMDQLFSTMNDSTFKALRRQLPVTKTKMNWANIQSQKMLN